MRVLLGLGGNLPATGVAFTKTLQHLAERGWLRDVSAVWRTPAVGPPQEDYFNAAVVVDVPCHPLDLLAHCLQLERQAGRDRRRETRWGPRVLDIDLLLAGGVVLVHPHLIVPHPHLHQRPFALLPACQVAGEWFHPRQLLTVRELANKVGRAGCEPVALAGWPV